MTRKEQRSKRQWTKEVKSSSEGSRGNENRTAKRPGALDVGGSCPFAPSFLDDTPAANRSMQRRLTGLIAADMAVNRAGDRADGRRASAINNPMPNARGRAQSSRVLGSSVFL